jgi:P4 family phage/plasmid primase-like protien
MAASDHPRPAAARETHAAPARWVDRAELARFVEVLFRNAGEGGTVSLRAFFDDEAAKKRDDKPFAIRAVRLNGSGLEPVIDAAVVLAKEALGSKRPVVVAPPIATFNGGRARERDLLEGLALSVELDERPQVSLVALRGVLGPPTLVVASGGSWADRETGELQDKLHAHWRLKEPTRTPEEHACLKRARTLACELVGADGSSKPAVHPMRWAGTVHRKNPESPRLARIIEQYPEAEITLEDALAELEGTAVLRGWVIVEDRAKSSTNPIADDDLLGACAKVMDNPLPPKGLGEQPRGEWAHWNRIGMAFWRASGGSEAGFTAFDAWSGKNAEKYDAAATRARWEHYRTSPPDRLTAATLVWEARLVDPAFRPRRTRPEGEPGAPGEPQERPAAEAGDTLLDLSHDGLALDLGREWGNEVRHVAAWGRWLFWTDSKWEIDERLLHMTRTREYLRQRADGFVRAAATGEVEGLDLERAEAIAKSLRSAQTVAHVLGLARSNRELAATVNMWDADRWKLNTPGGIVDLRTGELGPADPLAYCTKSAAVAPPPAGTPTPLWDAFLERIFRHDPELIPFMQRVLGYALTGLTSEHVLVFAWGQGGNGKGVLLNTASRLIGDYAAVAPSDLLLVTQSDRHPCDMAMLRGARFATAQEIAPGRAWDEPKLKSLTGGDPVTARYMRQDFFTYEPQFTLFVAGNHKPSLKGVDEAIRRRVLLVPFLQNIPAEERDKDLPHKLKAEWPAILRWMIGGCLEWQRQGLNPPMSVREASEDYLAAEDVLGQWLEERCIVSHMIELTKTASLYADWREWCERGGMSPGSTKTFSQLLSERGFRHRRDNAGKGFVGLGLRARAEHAQADREPGAGCAGCSDIDRNAHAGVHAYAHTHTPHMEEPGTSGTGSDDFEEFEL